MKLQDISQKLNSSLEARMLIKHITGLNDADLITADAIPMEDEQYQQLQHYVDQRLLGRPISKIIGYKEFYGRNFITTDDVLDPRPDSETLIDTVLRHCGDQKWQGRILDLGTGSGCLILTLLAEQPKATAVATDISDAALDIARKNAEKLGVANRIEFIKSNWFDSVEGEFDIIISNPPYIESEIIPTLQPDVKNFDPILALDGGNDGFDAYKMILPQIRTYLKKGGFVALEYGAGQSFRINEIAADNGLSDGRVLFDLAGHDRVFSAIHN